MKKNIGVFCYSYQKKNLDELFSLVEKISNNYNVMLTVIDQSSINKEDKYKPNRFFLNYIHIPWDSISSPIEYKKHFILTSKFDYYLQIGDQTKIDIEHLNNLILFLDKNESCLLTQSNLAQADFLVGTGINRNFIFAKKDSALKIKAPAFAKYNGEQEYIYHHATKDGLTVYEVSSKIVDDKTIDLNTVDYVPFNLNHNYNAIAEEVGLKKNRYEYNDVSYNIRKSKFDNILGERYINKTNVID
jgi:hypothetical protein